MVASRRTFLIGAAGAVLFGASYATGSFSATLAAAKRRVAQRSRLVQTRSGALEYAIAGRGESFLMIHGTGGGFDQGLRFAQGLIARDFEVIAPSRFGYLRSDFPDDPAPANQADAFIDLLDHLHIERLPVAGGSAGALPAAQFAMRHPDRCSELVLLVPAMNLTGRDPVEFTRLQRVLVDRLLTSNLWFWAMLKLAPNQLIGTLLATDPALLEKVSEEERRPFLREPGRYRPLPHHRPDAGGLGRGRPVRHRRDSAHDRRKGAVGTAGDLSFWRSHLARP